MQTPKVSGAVARVAVVVMFAFVAGPAATAQAADAAIVFKARCSGCHGPEGNASTPAAKNQGLKDLKSPDVQKKSDAELQQIIAKGSKKMPGFEKSLGADGVKDQVAYMRQLAKKK